MPLPRVEDDVRIAGVDVERERPAQRARTDPPAGGRRPGSSSASPDARTTAAGTITATSTERSRRPRGPISSASGRGSRPRPSTTTATPTIQSDQARTSWPAPKQQAEADGRASTSTSRVRTIRASTSSAPAVINIPSGSGWNIAPVLRTTGKNAKNPTDASHVTGRAGQRVRARRNTRTPVANRRERVHELAEMVRVLRGRAPCRDCP